MNSFKYTLTIDGSELLGFIAATNYNIAEVAERLGKSYPTAGKIVVSKIKKKASHGETGLAVNGR
jgi:ribosomal protein L18E